MRAGKDRNQTKAASQEAIMMIMRAAVPAIVMLSVFAFVGHGAAQTPQANRPIAKPLIGLELGPEMESVQGRSLCMQLTTYEPGASNSEHSHKDRPEVVYVLAGKIIDHRGDAAKEYGPGETFTADRNTMHWMENKGTVPAVMLVTGIANRACPPPAR
jgi:quercetin dioxygenase-like cupin family protein